MGRQSTRMYNANAFKLGLFALNCSGGLTMTKAPERWHASWDNNLEAARLADEAGLEFLLPVGRWHGYRGETDTEGTSFETLTWASGLLGATREVCVFGTASDCRRQLQAFCTAGADLPVLAVSPVNEDRLVATRKAIVALATI